MTEAEIAILSILIEKPRHGYEIEQVIEDRGYREWTEIAFSSIYYVLNKLEKEGLISGQLTPSEGQGAARKVYQVTEQGRMLHKKSVRQLLSIPQKRSSPFLLGFSNLPSLSREEIESALSEFLRIRKLEVGQLQNRVASQQPIPSFVNAMFDYSRTMAEAEIAWIEEWVQNMEVRDGED